VLEPAVVGEFVDLHPVAGLIVTILGGTFMGFVGLILAVPITMVIWREHPHSETVWILRRRAGGFATPLNP
jgi:predicted PurR-regulated permease PerM